MLLWWGVGKSPSSSLSCDPFPLDFYALGLWYSLGYARFGGRFVISGLGKHNSNIWNLVLGCLMWIVWLERNRCSFEDKEKTLDDLKLLCHRSLFKWSCCWVFTDCSSLFEFLSSLSLVS